MFLHKIRNLHFLLQGRQQNLYASITDGGIPSTPSPAPSFTENSGTEQHPALKLPELKKGSKEWKYQHSLKPLCELVQRIS